MHLFSSRRRRKMTRDRGLAAPALHLESLETRYLLSSSMLTTYGQLPLSFEPNVGQAAAGTDFIIHGDGAQLSLARGILSVAIQAPSSAKDPSPSASVLNFQLVGANTAAEARSADPLAGVSNYLIGNDPTKWHVNIPTYGAVDYANVYPGIDLHYHGEQGQLEYDFVVNPGSYPGAIRLQVEGAPSWSLDASGNLVLHTAAGAVVQKAPVAFQSINGVRRDVASRFVLQDNRSVGFAVAAYDASVPLTIDPVLVYSTYLGGSNNEDAIAIALDSSGSAYITGNTLSSNFPRLHGAPYNAGQDVMVAKLNAAGNGLVYATFLGGSADDFGTAIAVDSLGDAYVAAITRSNDFPAPNGIKQTLSGTADAILAKLNPAGDSLVYASYLGGSTEDDATAVAVDGSGAVYVAGYTTSTDFPTAHPLQGSFGGVEDAFVTKFNPAGSGLVYSTYLGGSTSDAAYGIAVDGSGAAYLTGATNGSFPTTQALQSSYGGARDGFVAKLNAAGSGLVFSTYLGGSNVDQGNAIALDSTGAIYVAGFTASSNFPTTTVFQKSGGLVPYAFVTKLKPAGTALVYSSILGNDAQANGLGVDALGEAYITGFVGSTSFPTVNAFQNTFGGYADAFFSRLNQAGNVLMYSTFLGGSSDETGNGLAVDSIGNAYMVGFTESTDFPTAAPFQAGNAGGQDGFVAKFAGHVWQGQDVTVGSDGKTRILWNTPTGEISVWSVSNSFAAIGGPAYGPINGWLPIDTAAGSDGLTRVLWRNASSGVAALWLVAPDGSVVNVGVFGPFSGWSAQDITVGTDNVTRLLWTNTSGAADVWRVDNNFNVTPSAVFGPFSGWSATKLARGADGLIRILWTQSGGAAALWLLNADGTYHSSTVFGPIQGWTATDVTVGIDGNTRILWKNGNAAMAIWSMNNAFSVLGASVFGPFTGWTPEAIEAGPDGLTRVLWDCADGTIALWLLGADGSFQNAGTFGPF